MDDICTSTFQRVDPEAGLLQVTFHPPPSLNAGDITVPCIVKTPTMEEDYIPGTRTAMLLLFIPPSAGLQGLMGYTATYGGIDYNIDQSDADRCGGIHLRLRLRSQPYNQ